MLSRVENKDVRILRFLKGEQRIFYDALAGVMPTAYFEVFADFCGVAPITVLMRCVGCFYLTMSEKSDRAEISAFLNGCGKFEVCGEGLQTLRLEGGRYAAFPLLRFCGEGKSDNDVRSAESFSELKMVHALIAKEGIFDAGESDEFYCVRRLFCQKRVSRVRGIFEGEKLVSTAQTLCEGRSGAMLGMVVTAENCRRRGLSARVIASLCGELSGEILIAAYSSGAAALYNKLGFCECGKRELLRFYS